MGILNSANAIPQSVNFNAVTIRNGAIINVNSNKSLTAIDNGNNLVADNTSSNAVKGDGISNSLSGFADTNYGSDELFSSSVAHSPKLMSEEDIKSYGGYISTVKSEYWLSNTLKRANLGIQSYATSDNSLVYNSLKVSGRSVPNQFENWTIAQGPYAFSRDDVFSNFVAGPGGQWELYGSMTQSLYSYFAGQNGNILPEEGYVYNNPRFLDSGTDVMGNAYKRSSLASGSQTNGMVFGYVQDNTWGIIRRAYVGLKLPKGKSLVWAFPEEDHIINDPSGFMSFTTFDYLSNKSKKYYIGFFNAVNKIEIKSGRSNDTVNLPGFTWWHDEATEVIGQPISAQSKAVRPQYNLNMSKIAFVRPNSSNSTLVTSSKFGDLPSSFAQRGQNSKTVVKSSDIKINNSLNSNRLTVTGSSGSATYSSSSESIIVPYGAKTLTILGSALPTTNANYISAVANDSSGTKHYAVLGKSGADVMIDLTTILNMSELGSSATVSLYAEKANGANTSDGISNSCVTFNVSVGQGASQRITYNVGEGTGSVPSTVNIGAGNSYVLANGLGLNKEGNPFSAWKVAYTEYGETSLTTRYVMGNEIIIIPNTTSGITATAMYSGMKATKSTESTPTLITITWDLNTSDDFNAKFDGTTVAGNVAFSDDLSKRFDKSVKYAEVTVPDDSTISEISSSYKFFDGWYTAKEGGTKVTGKVIANTNITYYAHWKTGYTVTYWADGGSRAKYSGKFSGSGKKYFDEVVLSGNKTKGPDSSVGDPTPNNTTNCAFFGWYTQPNGGGDYIDPKAGIEITGETSYYAYYDLADTFLAPASQNTANPRTIKGLKYNIKKVCSDADSIKDGTNPNPNIYNATNDSYHLYTRLKSGNSFLDAGSANNWAEFRIIGVGSSSDSGGLTFQMVHSLPSAYAYQNSANSESNPVSWNNSSLRTDMQKGGSIYNQFDSNLTGSILNSSKLYNVSGDSSSTHYSTVDSLTILSADEYVEGATGANIGRCYPYWSQYSKNGSPSYNKLNSLLLTRSGVAVENTSQSILRNGQPTGVQFIWGSPLADGSLFAKYFTSNQFNLADFVVNFSGVAVVSCVNPSFSI